MKIIIIIIKSILFVMPAKQTIDETIESITNKDKKKITKMAQSSAGLEKEQNFVTET
jgi:hypothetical protein